MGKCGVATYYHGVCAKRSGAANMHDFPCLWKSNYLSHVFCVAVVLEEIPEIPYSNISI
jgi:hypothetical protein